MKSDEEEIRKYFRESRDRLKRNSASFYTLEKTTQREEAKVMALLVAKNADWFAEVYEILELLFLSVHQLKDEFQKYEPIMKHFQEYLENVEQEKERFR
jgi:molecular chaperone GrpE (heat shock protein)